MFEARDLDGDGPGGHLCVSVSGAALRSALRAAVLSAQFSLASLGAYGDALPARLRTQLKMSYAATASFPASSFVLEAR